MPKQYCEGLNGSVTKLEADLMISFKTKFASLALIALALSQGAQPVGAGGAEKRIEQAKAISLILGTKRAIGYYMAENNACAATLLISEAFVDDNFDGPTATRVNMTIHAGTTSSVDTVDGRTLELSCGKDAKFMSVQTVERVAYEAPPRSIDRKSVV